MCCRDIYILGPSYDPKVARTLKKHHIQLPFGDFGQTEEDFRALAHLREERPGWCQCWHCRIIPYEPEIDKELWEEVRKCEAKQGRYIVSWHQKEMLDADLAKNEALVKQGLPAKPLPTHHANAKLPTKHVT